MASITVFSIGLILYIHSFYDKRYFFQFAMLGIVFMALPIMVWTYMEMVERAAHKMTRAKDELCYQLEELRELLSNTSS